jgi:hypothetical protein
MLTSCFYIGKNMSRVLKKREKVGKNEKSLKKFKKSLDRMLGISIIGLTSTLVGVTQSTRLSGFLK